MLFEHRYILYLHISQSAKHIHGYVTDSQLVHHWKVQIQQAADSDGLEKLPF